MKNFIKLSLKMTLMLACVSCANTEKTSAASPDSVKKNEIVAEPSADVNDAKAQPAEENAVAQPAVPKSNDAQLNIGEDSCKTDSDCVPSTCCHPKECVAKESKPNCENVPCTLICLGNTMDCGGGCLCHEGKCTAKMAGPFIKDPVTKDLPKIPAPDPAPQVIR